MVTVDALMASLKFAVTVVKILTPVAPFKGETDDTVGGVLSTSGSSKAPAIIID